MDLSKVTNIFNKTRYSSIPPVPESVWKNPLHFVAFGFGSGAMPFAPGTFGTLLAIPFYLMLAPLQPSYYLVTVILITIASIWICHKTEKEISVHDHQGMCLDEFVGFFVTMYHAPRSWEWVVFGFVLFRIFDIWKPWPIRYLDKNVAGGLGVILDDVAAGIYACIVLQIFAWM